MISNKKAAAETVEILVRIVIALVLLFAAFNIGKKVAGTIFGKSEAMNSFNKLADDLNSLELGTGEDFVRKETFISLDRGTAVVGFSKTAQEFKCYGCINPEAFQREGEFYYSINRPPNQECNNKPCICLCRKDFVRGTQSLENIQSNVVEINCGTFICKSLNDDIINRVSLESSLRKRGQTLINYPYWENGFFFVRIKNDETPSDGMVPPNNVRKIKIGIEKKRVNDQVYVATCPDLPCIQDVPNAQAAS